ncbi:hypothetical protein [Glutamicibacter nicotianae]|uniref:hypothetical protein n=1 Tax=Glutamicibacter nicotianae TaxID=37929 RepID=UPI002556B680|nr:hypothetical protein [Glutamicibacter nicotianae]WIV43783.1 hypothetical protein QQS42_15980 [Glutamicibacter nicotianae]
MATTPILAEGGQTQAYEQLAAALAHQGIRRQAKNGSPFIKSDKFWSLSSWLLAIGGSLIVLVIWGVLTRKRA